MSQSPQFLIATEQFTEDQFQRLSGLGPHLVSRSFDAQSALDKEAREAITIAATKVFEAFTPEQMDLFPNLKVIANFGVGYDNIDLKAAQDRGITVTNTPDVLDDDVADLALALMLCASRRIVQGDAHVRSGAWVRRQAFPLNRKMTGASVGIAGLGRIGRAIADRLVGFQMDIHYCARSEKDTPGWTYHADPVSLAKEVDWLVVAVVGGPETEGYISQEVLEALGPNGMLINIARGSCIDEAALLSALETGRIAGAGLDVYRNEPEIDPRFLPLDNVVLQPHQASGTVQTRRAMSELQCANIAAHLAGRALVTPVRQGD